MLNWYNRGGREFANGVTWVRVGRDGLGLWWSTKGDRNVCSRARLSFGRFSVAVLLPRDDD